MEAHLALFTRNERTHRGTTSRGTVLSDPGWPMQQRCRAWIGWPAERCEYVGCIQTRSLILTQGLIDQRRKLPRVEQGPVLGRPWGGERGKGGAFMRRQGG